MRDEGTLDDCNFRDGTRTSAITSSLGGGMRDIGSGLTNDAEGSGSPVRTDESSDTF